MGQQRLILLIQQWLNKTISHEDHAELMRFLAENQQNVEVTEAMQQVMEAEVLQEYDVRPDHWDKYIEQILNADKPVQGIATLPVHRVHFLRKWWWAAASILMLIVGALLYFNVSNTAQKVVTVQPSQPNGQPGKRGAILTLADGRQIVLDSLGNSTIPTQNGSDVSLEKGQLQYDPAREMEGSTAYNTMTTPRGQQFRIILSDGSKVWLNTASSITYPTRFAGNTRTVQLTGEAYFEIAKNTAQPFIVQLQHDRNVEVTGTHFNVKAYGDEPDIRTTLLEGAVTVHSAMSERKMKPGQQVKMLSNGSLHLTPNADTEQATAWMSRSFSFRNDDLETILKQLARWYNIEVKYERGIPKKKFTSNLSMDNDLNDILAILSQSGLKFSLENKILHVK